MSEWGHSRSGNRERWMAPSCFVEAVVERSTCGLRLNANELHVDINRKVPQPVLGYEWRHRREKCWLRTQQTSSNTRLPPVNGHMN